MSGSSYSFAYATLGERTAFAVFLLAGAVVHTLYGRRNSRLAAGPPQAGTETTPLVDA
ncbi:hypothetical protein GLX30_08590 [Streptomyces sp. Tu 2975]|uniref:hypothetical protein n=1 Tax=Streptomyces sp. Tu 2975 TaxID=2676871 RepID=UPI0014138FB6|nr:hypothetical protein [Streptomyces sp. Tu 2975]QIP82718.1 hypothetical protein GLX30_08590 [Streptomyces sp. Tu 2975]